MDLIYISPGIFFPLRIGFTLYNRSHVYFLCSFVACPKMEAPAVPKVTWLMRLQAAISDRLLRQIEWCTTAFFYCSCYDPSPSKALVIQCSVLLLDWKRIQYSKYLNLMETLILGIVRVVVREHNWSKWNVFQSEQAVFVSSTNSLGSTVPQSCLSEGLRRLEKQFG